MEAAIRTAHKLLTGAELKGRAESRRDAGDWPNSKSSPSPSAGRPSICDRQRSGGGQDPDRARAEGNFHLHFIEVMTCPGGCVGGGGQPYDTDTEAVKKRLRRIYEVDRGAQKRQSHENEQVQELYRAYLGEPLGPLSHRLLHRAYTDRKAAPPRLLPGGARPPEDP